MQQEVRSRTPGRSWSRSQLVLGVSGRPAGGSWEGRGWVRLLLSWWLWLREGQTNSSGGAGNKPGRRETSHPGEGEQGLHHGGRRKEVKQKMVPSEGREATIYQQTPCR